VSQSELLIEAAVALEGAGVGYMLTGSLASSLQGEPRATHDVDIVIELDVRAVDAIAQAFGAPDFFFDDLAAREALVSANLFNLLDTRSGDKIDFWPLTDGPFDTSRFSRRIETVAFGRPIAVSAPEDTILQKLKWAHDSGVSERQVRDAVAVYEVQAGALDEAYLSGWATTLGVEDLLSEVRARADTS
jgi:hypothetical protein